jgi:hypothetical protein
LLDHYPRVDQLAALAPTIARGTGSAAAPLWWGSVFTADQGTLPDSLDRGIHIEEELALALAVQ